MLEAEKTILLIQRHLDWGPLLPLSCWWDQSQWRWQGHLLPQQGRKPPTLGFLHTCGSEQLPGKTPTVIRGSQLVQTCWPPGSTDVQASSCVLGAGLQPSPAGQL